MTSLKPGDLLVCKLEHGTAGVGPSVEPGRSYDVHKGEVALFVSTRAFDPERSSNNKFITCMIVGPKMIFDVYSSDPGVNEAFKLSNYWRLADP